MARIEIDVSRLRMDGLGTVENQVWERVRHLGLEKAVQTELRFWKGIFNDAGTFAQPGKLATLRYAKNAIQIPKYFVLPIYETGEFHKAGKPRGFARIDKLIVGHASRLTDDELQLDGFNHSTEIIPHMKMYYPAIDEESLFSYFIFGSVKFKPNDHEIETYFLRRTNG